MAQVIEPIASDVEQLSERVRELERRVSALEGSAEKSIPTHSELASIPLQRPRTPVTWRAFPPAEMPGGAVAVIGKAVLGIAGAYLLRAIAESGPILRLTMLVVAIVYAGMWLVWAARAHAASRFASFSYAITSALILSPLLWESSVRFQVLPVVLAAAVLIGFVVLALATGWKQKLQAIPWIATLAAVGTAMALIIATRELVPLTIALLVVALAAEVVDGLGYRLSVRVVPAIAADFAVWLLVYIMMFAEGVPVGYHAIGAGTLVVLSFGLLAIYGGSIGIRSFVLRRKLSLFEIAQGVVAFALATFSTLRASPGSAPVLGGFFLIVAALCYRGVLSRFGGDALSRNRRVFATYAAALLLVGSFLLLGTSLQALFLCVAALVAVLAYTRTGEFSLGIHAMLYLVTAAIGAGLLSYAGGALAGTVPKAPAWAFWVVLGSAILCEAIGSRPVISQRRWLWVIPSALVGLAGAALVVVAIVSLVLSQAWLDQAWLSAARLAVIRTVVICAVALAFGFGAARSQRIEWRWVAYAAVACGTLKLAFEDLRFGNPASLVVSLLFYGLILIVLPRLMRSRQAETPVAGKTSDTLVAGGR